jgi:uncharacterized YigZ family protein
MALPEIASYYTLAWRSQVEVTIQKSRFIGIAFPAFTEEAALEEIADIRKQFSDCSSLCFGYVCGFSGQLQRFSDDHEPVGGMPILDAIRKKGLTGCGCAVVRYFGGIKLGMGGLARAFGSTAIAAVEAAGPGLAEKSLRYTIIFEYALRGKMEYFLSHSPYRLVNVEFAQDVTMTIWIRAQERERFEAQVMDLCSGRIVSEVVEETYILWDQPEKG